MIKGMVRVFSTYYKDGKAALECSDNLSQSDIDRLVKHVELAILLSQKFDDEYYELFKAFWDRANKLGEEAHNLGLRFGDKHNYIRNKIKEMLEGI